jgi:hypothetical protein
LLRADRYRGPSAHGHRLKENLIRQAFAENPHVGEFGKWLLMANLANHLPRTNHDRQGQCAIPPTDASTALERFLNSPSRARTDFAALAAWRFGAKLGSGKTQRASNDVSQQ